MLCAPDYVYSVPLPSGRFRAYITSRWGGVSQGAFSTFNLASHVGDACDSVLANRLRLMRQLNLPPAIQWLDQVHGTDLVEPNSDTGLSAQVGDGIILKQRLQAGVVLTADCLPVFLARKDDKAAAVVHAGWRGLSEGILVRAVDRLLTEPGEITAFIGPGIAADLFEVGVDVYLAFVQKNPAYKSAFIPSAKDKWRALLSRLACIQLKSLGVSSIKGWGVDLPMACGAGYFRLGTGVKGYSARVKSPFFSYRAEKQTGRFASILCAD